VQQYDVPSFCYIPKPPSTERKPKLTPQQSPKSNRIHNMHSTSCGNDVEFGEDWNEKNRRAVFIV